MAYLLNTSTTVLCTHAGTVSAITTNTRVKASGEYVVTISDLFMVTGCVFQVGPKPQPCVKIQWLVPAKRVRVNGQQVLTQSSTGVCLSVEQIPQGPPNVVTTQLRVQGQ
jgi:hypothetical protein